MIFINNTIQYCDDNDNGFNKCSKSLDCICTYVYNEYN